MPHCRSVGRTLGSTCCILRSGVLQDRRLTVVRNLFVHSSINCDGRLPQLRQDGRCDVEPERRTAVDDRQQTEFPRSLSLHLILDDREAFEMRVVRRAVKGALGDLGDEPAQNKSFSLFRPSAEHGARLRSPSVGVRPSCPAQHCQFAGSRQPKTWPR